MPCQTCNVLDEPSSFLKLGQGSDSSTFLELGCECVGGERERERPAYDTALAGPRMYLILIIMY